MRVEIGNIITDITLKQGNRTLLYTADAIYYNGKKLDLPDYLVKHKFLMAKYKLSNIYQPCEQINALRL